MLVVGCESRSYGVIHGKTKGLFIVRIPEYDRAKEFGFPTSVFILCAEHLTAMLSQSEFNNIFSYIVKPL